MRRKKTNATITQTQVAQYLVMGMIASMIGIWVSKHLFPVSNISLCFSYGKQSYRVVHTGTHSAIGSRRVDMTYKIFPLSYVDKNLIDCFDDVSLSAELPIVED